MVQTSTNYQTKSKYTSMSRRQLEEAAHDRLVASMEYNGDEDEVWAQVRSTSSKTLISFLEEE